MIYIQFSHSFHARLFLFNKNLFLPRRFCIVDKLSPHTCISKMCIFINKSVFKIILCNTFLYINIIKR